MRHIETHSKADESIDETLKRLLKLVTENKSGPPAPPPLTTTIKVSRMVMNHIIKQSKTEESRDRTLSRLLGIEQDDGNVRGN
jgi:ribosomal protein S10